MNRKGHRNKAPKIEGRVGCLAWIRRRKEFYVVIIVKSEFRKSSSSSTLSIKKSLKKFCGWWWGQTWNFAVVADKSSDMRPWWLILRLWHCKRVIEKRGRKLEESVQQKKEGEEGTGTTRVSSTSWGNLKAYCGRVFISNNNNIKQLKDVPS